MVKIEKIEELLEEWKDTEAAHHELVLKRDALEKEIMSIMVENIWKDYSTPTGIHVSLVDEEESHVDINQLSVLLSKSDFNSVMRHNTKRNLIIVTPDGRKRLRKMLRV